MNRARSTADWVQRVDYWMILWIGILAAIGVAFIYSAASGVNEQTAIDLCRRQLMWLGIGAGGYLLFAWMDYRRLTEASWLLYVFGLILVALVFVPHVGVKVYGARRWIQLLGFRFLQPAEVMKLVTILLLAHVFGQAGPGVRHLRYVFLGLGLILIPMGLIIKQPDLGTALVFLPVLVAIMFVTGVPVRVFGVLAVVMALLGGVALSAVVLPPRLGWSEAAQVRTLKCVGLNPYQRNRIMVFLDSNRDPMGAGWNKAQSQIAVGSGRFWGKGYLQGTQNILGFLPRPVAHNDFIFSVIAEEKGFVGSMTLLALYALLLHRCIRAAELAADATGRALCAGITTLLFCHVFVNMAMTIGLAPITGIPLPLISYGGTFVVGTLSALGWVQSVRIRGEA